MVDLETIEDLLLKAEKQLEFQRQHQKETGDAFNIFTVLDRERKEESTHCRLIYELLNPEGSHGCGDVFLQRFFQDVLGKEYKNGAKVYREKNIDNGRIDLVIEGESYYYPIEVKIDAGDQSRQIERYFCFAEKQRKGRENFDTKVYYLTLNGHEPSKESLGEVLLEQVRCISFQKEIHDWLNQCEEIVANTPNINIILKQYIQLLDQLEGIMDMDELAQRIGSSKNDYESAAEIAKRLPIVQARKMQSVFEEIEKIIGKQFDKIEEYSTYQQDAEKYYTVGKRMDPSLAYCIRSAGELRVELWFQVDRYDDFLWYGIVLRKGENVPKSQKDVLEFSTVIKRDSWKEKIEAVAEKYSWWVWAKKPLQNDLPNFNPDDKRYSDLFDKEKFAKTIENIQAEISHQLEHIKETGLPINSSEK